MCSTSFQEHLETRVFAATAEYEDSVANSTARGLEGFTVAAAEGTETAGFFVDFPPFFFLTLASGAESGEAAAGEARSEGLERAGDGANSSPALGEDGVA